MATDFSKASENAYRYCLMLAESKPCHFLVAHVYKHHSSVNLGDDQIQTFMESKRSEVKDRTRRFSRLYPDAVMPEIVSQCTVEVLVAEGTVSDSILQLAEKNDADVIVIGSKSHPGLLKRMFGQISSTLIYGKRFPVLIVPEDSVEVSTERIGLLCLNSSDEERLLQWKKRTSLAIHDYRVCRIYESSLEATEGEVIMVSDKPTNDVVQVLNSSDFHWFAILVEDRMGELGTERRNFIHDLYRRSRKPILCLS